MHPVRIFLLAGSLLCSGTAAAQDPAEAPDQDPFGAAAEDPGAAPQDEYEAARDAYEAAVRAPRVFLRLNGAYPITPQGSYEWRLRQYIYDEQAIIHMDQTSTTGVIYDATVGARIWRGLAAAASVTYSDNGSTAAANGTIPSPLFADSPRPASFTAALGREQLDVHLQAVYFLPLVDFIDIAISAGPSLLRVTHDQPTAALIRRETVETLDTDLITGLDTMRFTGTGIGANVGVDIALMPTRVFGVGIFIRYITGQVDLGPPGGAQVDAGGLQAGAGLRFRF